MPTAPNKTTSAPSINSLLLYGLSPCGLAVLSYLVFLLTCMIPPATWTHYLEEPNYIFLEPATILFYTVCVGGFVAGVLVVQFFFPLRTISRFKLQTLFSSTAFILIPVLTGLALCTASLVLLVRNNPDLLLQLATQRGSELKENFDLQQTLATAGIWLLAIIWWAASRYRQIGLKRSQVRIVQLALVLALIVSLLSAVLKLGRLQVMYSVTGLAVVYLVTNIARRELGPAFLVRFCAVFVLVVVSLFVLFSYIRGGADLEKHASDLMGYTIAGYNRLAAVLQGRLHYPFGGTGVYLSAFVSFNHSLNSIIPIHDMMGWGAFDDVWRSEFGATWAAGLNGNLIWLGAFGYLFEDVGWLTPAVLLIYGIFYGVVWRFLRAGSAIGITLYPWLAFCVLFWFGMNALLDAEIVIFAIVGLSLVLYERLFTRREALGSE